MMHSEKINEIVTHFVVPKNYDPGILYEVGAHDIACFDAADHSPPLPPSPDDPAAAAQAERLHEP